MNELPLIKNKHRAIINELITIAINGLNDLFLPAEQEFSEKKILRENSIINEGTNRRYTLINLLGLYRAKSSGFNISTSNEINLKLIISWQIKDINKYQSAGDIGLLLWCTALIAPDLLPTLMNKIDLKGILNHYKDGRQKITMELSWLLIGIIYSSKYNRKFKESVGDLALRIYEIIKANYRGNGIFEHQNTR